MRQSYVRKVGSDVDGVWADFNYGFTLMAKKLGYTEKVFTCKDSTTYYHMNQLFTNKQLQELWGYVNESETFWENLPPVTLASNHYSLDKMIQDKKIDFYLMTQRMGVDPQGQTQRWFKHFMKLDIPRENIIICSRNRRLDLVKRLDLDYYIDDCPDTLLEVSELRSPMCFGVEYSFNSEIRNTENINWVKSVGEYVNQIFQYTYQKA